MTTFLDSSTGSTCFDVQNAAKCETRRITHKQDKSKESYIVDPNGEILKSVKISYVELQYRTISHGAIIFTKSSIKLTKSLCH